MIASDHPLLKLFVRHFPLLNEPAFLAELRQLGVAKQTEAGQPLIESDSDLRMVPLVVEGAVRVLRTGADGKEILLYYLFPGETCAVAVSCCYSIGPSPVRAVAEEAVSWIGLPAQRLDEWIERHRVWRQFVLMTWQGRYEEMLQTLDAVVFMRMDERLLQYLQRRASATGGDLVRATHQEVALELATTREVVSRLLKQMEQRGWVELGRNQIRLLRREHHLLE